MIPVPLATNINSGEKIIASDCQHVHIPPENKVPMTAAAVTALAYTSTAYPACTGSSAAPPPPYSAFSAAGPSAGYPPVGTFPA